MHPERTARGDDQLAPAAGPAIPAALEATPCHDDAVSLATINSGCALLGCNTTVRQPAPVAIARVWHRPQVPLQRAVRGRSPSP